MKAALGLMIVSSLLVMASCEQTWWALQKKRRAEEYLIPEGLTGWVSIEYKAVGAPALPIEEGRLILRIPASGNLRTSTSPEYGWAEDKYFWVDSKGKLTVLPSTSWGGGGMIWGRSTGSRKVFAPEEKPEQVFSKFFIGTEEEFRQATADS